MSQAQAVAETDRLPWLADEAPPERRGRRGGLAFLAVVGALIVAAAAYWIGSNAIERPVSTQPSPQPVSAVPIEQPPAAAPEQLPAQPQVNLEAAPQVTPVPAPQVPIARPYVRHRVVARSHPRAKAQESASADESTGNAATGESAKPAAEKPLKLWPATESNGAEGRIVRIGAFGSRQQAKVGWRYMVRSYPAVAHLPATVVGDRNSNGEHFYRFQIGTTSQAHSEVLCQRMERIQFSCAVVGLPWKPKGVER
ncbi:MAG TPA: hypothetical protein VE820_01005 [Sphingomicrobium sp.]|jgi:hypothetical protein|nr:hypothetical protein [Sphingomicrobium sp.]